jgi:hypothetical protein
MSLITGKKVKIHTSQGIVKKKPNVQSLQKNGLMWPYGLIFSEYSKVFRIGTKSATQNRCKKFPQAT